MFKLNLFDIAILHIWIKLLLPVVVIYAATWATFKPKLKRDLKNPSSKKILTFQEIELSRPRKP